MSDDISGSISTGVTIDGDMVAGPDVQGQLVVSETVDGGATSGLTLNGTLAPETAPDGQVVTGNSVEGQITGGPTGPQGAQGPQGETGATGAKGDPGEGVPTGGATGQVLTKQSATDYDASWSGAPYYQYIYNSSGDQEGNRFNDWADLIAAIDGREAIIQFQQNEVIPVGHWNLPYQIWRGNGQNPDGGGLVIEFPEGCYIDSWLNFSAENGLNLYSTSTTHPTYEMTTAHVISFNRTAIYTDDIEFVKVTGTGLVGIQATNGFGFYNDSGAGLGNYEVFNIDSVAYGTVIVTTEQGVSPTIQNNTIRSDTPIVYGWLKQSSEVRSGYATQANLAPFSVNFNGEPGGNGGALFSNAYVVGFLEGQPTGIESDNVADALSELELRNSTVDFVFNSSDSGNSGRRYNNWADCYAAARAVADFVPVRIHFEQPEVLDAGSYNLDNITLWGWNSSIGVNPTSRVELPEGFVITSWQNGGADRFLALYTTNTSTPIFTVPSGLTIISLNGGASFFSGGSEVVFDVGSGAVFAVKVDPAGGMENATLLTGSGHEVINMSGSGAFVWFNFGGAIGDQSIRGDCSGGQVAIFNQIASGMSNNWASSNVNLTGSPYVNNLSRAYLTSFDNSTSDLDADDVQEAIDELVSVGTKQVVHGSDSTVVRPPWQMVIWVGTVEPDNMAVNDLWINA